MAFSAFKELKTVILVDEDVDIFDKNDVMWTINTRFPSHSGRFHKDDVLADVILEDIVALLPQNATITSGIHVDGITKEQLQASFGMAKHLGQQIADWLQTISLDASQPTYYKK